MVCAIVSAVIRVRFWWQLGQRQRCWQEKATNISCRQSGQRRRAKPKCKSPQRRNRRATSPMIGRQGPYCLARAPVISPLKLGQVSLDRLIQRRMTWPARPVNRGGLCGETDHGNATFRFQCGKGGDTAVDLSAEGYKSTLCRWREVSGEGRVFGAIAGTVSGRPRPTQNHHSNSRAWAARCWDGCPPTALGGQVCGLNWRTLKEYKSPQRNSARSPSTAVGWTTRSGLRDGLRAFGANDRRHLSHRV
jgi:hypothetical protein